MKMTLICMFLFGSASALGDTCMSLKSISTPGKFIDLTLSSDEDAVFSYDGTTIVEMGGMLVGTASKSIRVVKLRKNTCSEVAGISVIDTTDSKKVTQVFVKKPMHETSNYNCLGGSAPTIFIRDYSSKMGGPEALTEGEAKTLSGKNKFGSFATAVGDCKKLVDQFVGLPNQLQ